MMNSIVLQDVLVSWLVKALNCQYCASWVLLIHSMSCLVASLLVNMLGEWQVVTNITQDDWDKAALAITLCFRMLDQQPGAQAEQARRAAWSCSIFLRSRLILKKDMKLQGWFRSALRMSSCRYRRRNVSTPTYVGSTFLKEKEPLDQWWLLEIIQHWWAGLPLPARLCAGREWDFVPQSTRNCTLSASCSTGRRLLP